MGLVPQLDLTPIGDAQTPGPMNLELEHALLGVLLYEPERFFDVAGRVEARHFWEPVHGRIFAKIESLARDGDAVEPVLVAELMRADLGLRDLGGVKFLADLVDKAPGGHHVGEYADQIAELSNRRRLIELAAIVTQHARDGDAGTGSSISSGKILEALQSEIATLARSRVLEPTGLDDAVADVISYVDDRSIHRGIPWGLQAIQSVVGDMLPHENYMIAARPSMGKTALAQNIALRVAAPSWWAERETAAAFDPDATQWRPGQIVADPAGVLLVNGEMSPGQMSRRFMADVGFALYGEKFPSYRDIRNRRVTVEQRAMMDHARAEMTGWPIAIKKRSGTKVSEILQMAKRQFALWRAQGLKRFLIIIDHAGLVAPEGKSGSRYEAQTEVAVAVHDLAEKADCPVIVLLQLSRGVEQRDDKRPRLEDLKDSGGWEENADVVIFPFQKAHYAAQETAPPRDAAPGSKEDLAWADWSSRLNSKAMEMIFGKVREGSRAATTEAWVEMSHNALRNAEPLPVGVFI
jgi:replicative DNA helicase